jgi:hypothetical protein
MQRREFIAAVGTAAALASASKAFAQAAGGGEMEEPMHPPKYEALEKAAAIVSRQAMTASGIASACIR